MKIRRYRTKILARRYWTKSQNPIPKSPNVTYNQKIPHSVRKYNDSFISYLYTKCLSISGHTGVAVRTKLQKKKPTYRHVLYPESDGIRTRSVTTAICKKRYVRNNSRRCKLYSLEHESERPPTDNLWKWVSTISYLVPGTTAAVVLYEYLVPGTS